jgi:DNA-binding helix-hairpin-helix protein with protein kinase domain
MSSRPIDAPILADQNGAAVRLGPKIGRTGGEGTVYSIAGHADLVAKVYHQAVTDNKAAKLKYLAQRVTPQLSDCAAWPSFLLFDHKQPRGFVMRAVGGKEVHHVYGSRDRVVDFPGRNWDFLVNTARNCAAAFDEVHSIGAVIGDVNEGNFLVQANGRVTLIDCDSFQISNGAAAWTCDVGVPWWTPPELQGKSFRGLVRTPNHDCFGLAILVFKLLFMGQHPYAGIPITDTQDAIRRGLYAFSRTAGSYGVRPPPYTFPVAALPEMYCSMFESALRLNPSRPTAKEWVHALDALLQTIVQCRSDKSHKFPGALRRCPWCQIASEGGPLFFVSIAVVVVGPLGENIAAVWAAISRIQRVELVLKEPQLPTSTVSAAPLPENAKTTRPVFVCGLVLYLVAFVLLIAGSTFPAIIAAVFATGMVCEGRATPAFIAERKRRQSVLSQIERDAAATRSQIDELIKKYNSEFDKASAELRQTYQRFSGLDHEKQSELQGLERDKRQLQLNDFLRTQLVSRGKIKGIGFVRKQLLLSYGVGSALDIRPNLDIPGFGPTYISYLMNWRRSCEMRFQYDPSRGVPPVELQRVNLKFTTLRNDLSTKLKQGPTSLTNLSAGAQARCLQLQGQFEMAYRRFAQARADLDLCR